MANIKEFIDYKDSQKLFINIIISVITGLFIIILALIVIALLTKHYQEYMYFVQNAEAVKVILENQKNSLDKIDKLIETIKGLQLKLASYEDPYLYWCTLSTKGKLMLIGNKLLTGAVAGGIVIFIIKIIAAHYIPETTTITR